MTRDIEIQFLRLGIQYYVVGRSAVLARLSPVCGNLLHHAVEAYLKARLSQKHSLKELEIMRLRERSWRAVKHRKAVSFCINKP